MEETDEKDAIDHRRAWSHSGWVTRFNGSSERRLFFLLTLIMLLLGIFAKLGWW